ncbi:MAG: NAD+ synthase [Deltaproteobacteria bacterium]|nr:NAD+ synthase [Deltaproteobacteria bacterium]MBW2418301.1 NAD+ synthase [Deltaproteobacteria bacterium]
MKIAIAQVNPTVGDLKGNRGLVEEAARRAESAGAGLVVLPEMVLTGYPPMDLLEREGFVEDQLRELEALEAASHGVSIVLGAVLPWEQGRPKQLANAAVLLANGKRVATRAKSLLPSYDVFDERRYFVRAEKREPVRISVGAETRSVGLAVCEDTWVSRIAYDVNPVHELVRDGAELILNPSASPWHVGKARARQDMLAELARASRTPVVFVNQVGGNDELVFDGGSFACDADGRVVAQLPLFESAFTVVDLPEPAGTGDAHTCAPMERAAELEAGLALGIRDYFEKQNLPPGAVIGLSGGIDSAVTAHLAVEALGADRVLGIAMPGPFSSRHSVDDAHALGELLGIEVREVDITPVFESYRSIFAALFGDKDDYGLTQQNIQSRIRGAVLMAASNQEGRLVLATGNKSELSVGYCTLYGDTVGGLAVLGDVYKHDVYAIAHHANRAMPRIPENTIAKPPSAELAPDQLDTDDLPDYDVLDSILEQCIEGGVGSAGIKPPPGCTPQVAAGIVHRLDRNEYKRRQAPMVLRTTPKAFGSGRRLPIVHRYRS